VCRSCLLMVVHSSSKPKLFRCVAQLHQILLLTRKDYFLFFHLFVACSILIPNGFPLITPFFNEGIIFYRHAYVAIENLLVTTMSLLPPHPLFFPFFAFPPLMATKTLLVITQLWQRVATKQNFGHHATMAIKNLLVATCRWQLKKKNHHTPFVSPHVSGDQKHFDPYEHGD